MKYPKVTVGITVKNSIETIRACIDSVLASTYRNYDVLVVDAFSTDGTWEFLKSYGKKIRAVQKAGNISVGRNEIIKKADGEMIAFTDADCVVEKNWLKNLVSAFTEKEIVAAGGFCGTSSGANYFQSLIGRELEDRFNHFPKFVSRLPFMNLCVRTAAAKETLLDDRLGAAEDADFGYRLTLSGKMLYVPDARIFHNHRGSIRDFFKQQFNYGKFAPLMYKKFSRKISGDHISKPTMMVQPPLFLVGTFFLLISYFTPATFILSEISLGILLLIYLFDALRLTKNILDLPAYILIFVVRTLAWILGVFAGIKNILY